MYISTSLLRLSTVVVLTAVLSSCAYIIPEDPNVPRNNTVLGDMRKPQLNMNSAGAQTAATPRPVAMPTAAATPGESMNLPPVDAATQAQAEKVMATQAMQTNAPAPANNGRRVPVENQQFQVSSADFPPINSVPPRPAMTGEASAQSRLNETKASLEKDRAEAIESKETLAKDAAAEPSMLSDLPKTDKVVPANDPVQVTPAIPHQESPLPPLTPAAAPVPNSVTVPALRDVRQPIPVAPKPSVAAPLPPLPPQAVVPSPVPAAAPVAQAAPRIVMPAETVSAALPPTPNFAPPAPLGAYPAAPVVRMQPQPVAASAPVAMPPVIAAPTMAAPASTPVAAANAPRVVAGDFNPLAVADHAPAPVASTTTQTASAYGYANSRYIAPSRYADRRY